MVDQINVPRVNCSLPEGLITAVTIVSVVTVVAIVSAGCSTASRSVSSKFVGVLMRFFTTPIAVVSALTGSFAYDAPVIAHENIRGRDMAGGGIKIIFGIVGVSCDRNFYSGGRNIPMFAIRYIAQ